MSTQLKPAPESTALGQPRWFFGMIAEVKASSEDTGGQYTLLEVNAPPGLEAPLHVHHAEDEGFLLLEGSLRLTVGDEEIELAPGEHAFGPREVPHKFAVGAEGARMLWVLTPGGFEHMVDAVSVPAESDGFPPPEVGPPPGVEEIVRRFGNEILG